MLDKAKLRLEVLEKEADELRTFIRMYVKLSVPSGLPTVAPPGIGMPQKFYGGGEGFSSKEAIVDAARDVLREVAPRPMLIGELFDALIERGIRISGKNPKGNLSAKLAPPQDIVYVKNEGWYYRPNENEAPAGAPEARTEHAGGMPGFPNPNHGQARR